MMPDQETIQLFKNHIKFLKSWMLYRSGINRHKETGTEEGLKARYVRSYAAKLDLQDADQDEKAATQDHRVAAKVKESPKKGSRGPQGKKSAGTQGHKEKREEKRGPKLISKIRKKLALKISKSASAAAGKAAES